MRDYKEQINIAKLRQEHENLDNYILSLNDVISKLEHKNQCKESRIKQLEEIIQNLNTRIDFAVGYISATQPHTDKHPMEVKRWLFEGLKHD
jgi:peptidoglycan hydrolase CwlO-like protein